MFYLLTENQLHENIIELKDNIDEFDYNYRNLVFLNAYSFYDHINRHPPVSGLLDTIEPYIPLSLDAESIDMFINAAHDEEPEAESADFFMLKARVDFVHSLQKANTPERWARLLEICGAIRDIKEQLLWLAL